MRYVYRIHTTNIGDLSSCPADYMPIPGAIRRIDVTTPPEGIDPVILGGGGVTAFKESQKWIPDAILWGIGIGKYTGAKLVGTREWGIGHHWVPCVSCMAEAFTIDRKLTDNAVIYERLSQPCLTDISLPRMNNSQSDIRTVLGFLGKAEFVYTNSYHGAYWATLLGRKVILVAPSGKFDHFPWKIPSINDSSGMAKAERTACEYPEALEQSRQANLSFLERVIHEIQPKRRKQLTKETRNLLLHNTQGLGDAVMMTSLVKSLNEAGYVVDAYSHYQQVFKHNPRRMRQQGDVATFPVVFNTHLFKRAESEKRHLIEIVGDEINEALGTSIEFKPIPELFLSEQERIRPHDKPYWLVFGGGKRSITTKFYPHYKQIIERTADLNWVQITHKSSIAVETGAALKLADLTPREMIRWIAHCEGILCPITAAIHIGAAFNKPAVVLNGGRESPQAIKYPRQIVLSNFTCGGPCWKTRCQLYDEHAFFNNDPCPFPIMHNEVNFPKCMDEIDPDRVVKAIRSAYESGVS